MVDLREIEDVRYRGDIDAQLDVYLPALIAEVVRCRAELTTLLKTAEFNNSPGCQRCARKIKSVLGDNSE